MFKKYIEKIVRNEIAYMKENEKQDKKMYENSEIYALETENSSLNEEIYALKSENSSLKKEIEILQNEKIDLKNYIDFLEISNKAESKVKFSNSYENLTKENKELKQKNENLKRWKNEYSKSFDNLTKDYMELKQKIIHYTKEEKELAKNEYLHQSQIAKRFGYSESTISYWVKKGKLKPRGFKNKRIIFCVAEVERDLKAIGKFKGIIGTD
jgi:DNA-binding transcriptional MerR regulator